MSKYDFFSSRKSLTKELDIELMRDRSLKYIYGIETSPIKLKYC